MTSNPMAPGRGLLNKLLGDMFLLVCVFSDRNTTIKGVLTNVYGPSIFPKKVSFLQTMSWAARWVGDKQRIIGGDFNLITSLGEKKGGSQVLGATSESFKEFIEENQVGGCGN